MPDDKPDYMGFVDPQKSRSRLLVYSHFVLMLDILKLSIVDTVKSVYTGVGGRLLDSDYTTQVLARDSRQSPLRGSLDWLVTHEVLSERDKSDYLKAVNCRNQIAHELLDLVYYGRTPVEFERSERIVSALIDKVEMWFMLEHELPISGPDGWQDMDDFEILSGRMTVARILSRVILQGDQSIHQRLASEDDL